MEPLDNPESKEVGRPVDELTPLLDAFLDQRTGCAWIDEDLSEVGGGGPVLLVGVDRELRPLLRGSGARFRWCCGC